MRGGLGISLQVDEISTPSLNESRLQFSAWRERAHGVPVIRAAVATRRTQNVSGKRTRGERDHAAPVAHRIVIEGGRRLGWTEEWRSVIDHREVLAFLAMRDVKVRYAQALLGALWALIQPVLMMLVFWAFLGRVAQPRSAVVSYPLFALAGLVPWTFFSSGVGACTESIVGSSNLVTKTYFPRVLIPAGAVLAWVPDLAIGSFVLAAVALFGGHLASQAALFPLGVALLFLAAIGAGLWTSALNVSYRDVRYAMPFLMQLWLLATPVAYPATIVPARYRWLVGLNPVAGPVEILRTSMTGSHTLAWPAVALSVAVAVVVAATGLFYFRRAQTTFADVI